jgi:WD40 repeat protein
VLAVVMVLALGIGLGGAGLAGFGGFAESERPAKATPSPELHVKVTNRSQEKKKTPLPTDLYGDPLPEGAVSRLGTIRFRHDANSTVDIAYSPDGKVLASAGAFGFGVCLWDAATGQPLHRLSVPEASTAVAFSPDGKTLFAAGLDALSFIDVATGKELRRLDEVRNNKWSSAAFSPDGTLVAVGDRTRGGARVVLWDVVTCKEVRRLEWKVDETDDNYGGTPLVAFSPGGKLLASGSDDKMVHLWDVATGKELDRLKGHQKKVWSVAFGPDGKVLASAGEDGSVRLWELPSGKPLKRLRIDEDSMPKLAFSPGGKQLASGSPAGLCLWDLETGKELYKWPTFAGQMAFSPDGKVLAALAGEAALHKWDTSTGKELGVVASHTGKIHSLHFAPDGKTLFSLGWERKALAWNLTNSRAESQLVSEPLGTFSCTSNLTAADLSADGRVAALAMWAFGPKEDNADPDIHLVDTTTGKELHALPGRTKELDALPGHNMVRSLKFSPDAKLLISGDSDTLRLWDVATGKELVQLEGQQRSDGQLAFSPDSSLLAYTGVDGTIRLWEIATRKELRRWDCGEKSLRLLVFSPDGKFIANSTFSAPNGVTSATGGVCVWDCATGKMVVRFGGEPRVRNILFSASARTIMVSEQQWRNLAGGDLEILSTIHIREVLSGQEIRQIDTPQKQVDSLALSPDGRTLASGGSDSTILLWDLTGQAANSNQKPAPLTAAQLHDLWSDLAGDAPKADRALWSLALAPAQSLPFLKTRMQPLPAAPADQVAKLIADFDSDRFAVRQEAVKALEQMGEPAEAALRKALESNAPLEVRQRIQQILEKGNKEIIRKLRAIETLEQIGNAEARQALEAFASCAPNPRVTEAANAALKRLANRPSGTQ